MKLKKHDFDSAKKVWKAWKVLKVLKITDASKICCENVHKLHMKWAKLLQLCIKTGGVQTCSCP